MEELSGEGQLIDKMSNPLINFVHTQKSKIPQSLFCDCISEVFLQKIFKRYKKDGRILLSRKLNVTNLFITSFACRKIPPKIGIVAPTALKL